MHQQLRPPGLLPPELVSSSSTFCKKLIKILVDLKKKNINAIIIILVAIIMIISLTFDFLCQLISRKNLIKQRLSVLICV